MHSTLVRAQNVFGFFTTVAFAVAALIAFTDIITPRTPKASLSMSKVEVYNLSIQSSANNSILTSIQCPRPTKLLLDQERRIRQHKIQPKYRLLLTHELEHQANLRLRVSVVAQCHRQFLGADERGGYLGYDHHESKRGSLAEHWASGNEEAEEECRGESN